MEEDLEPDHIGRIGERQFEMLCERAGLICNKSTVDVMGWDFIVEFPMTSAGLPSLPLDQRPINAGRVQLKSTLGRARNRIRLSLSAIERLAKDSHPALIIVFRMRGDGELQSAYLVHLIGNELARVLKRLRKADARKAHDINHTDISYDYEKVGLRFEPTAAGLLAALSAACGQNPGAYTIEKQRQLVELGYENGQFEAEALIQIDGPEHFNNLLLGLTPLKPQRLRVFDSRFGIRLPYKGTLFDDIEELHLVPPTLGRCEISIRGRSFGQASRFDAEMFIGPPLAALDGPELLIRSSNFIVRLTPRGLKFESVGSIDDMERSLEEWAELLRALTLMSTGRATLTISGNDRIPPITFHADQSITGPYLEELPLLSAFADGWLRLLTKAGMRSTATFPLNAFWEANEARMAVDILLNPQPEARFEFESIEIGEVFPPLQGLYFNIASFVDTSIAFSAKIFLVKTEDPDWQYRSTRFEALDVRPEVNDLEEYGIDQANASGLKLVINPKNITTVSHAERKQTVRP
ncbi:hypothetical protein LYZ77_21985 [Xanthomonas hortorum pv. vitians]|uniref:hypothetical protein n=1 Tax=Xanthomonas hortorum TaxID=56454 RepID=UPI0012AA27A5|nr:hypothetical protein [Xanthomonas hortorum]MCE4283000.1 hypothetical protein [Xanthomonas hortorum pv. vitians]MCE4287494.1 hypothetical protein [Xanthomonas hortorum pv. vitians]MCE4291857.1 hypothetical protein [Xanthomonas hortorum pv. vitians]MCE4296175.1 hypothetical protein [Xanthomonas hortorum pv. vitians]MDT7854935.1 hypothetical protein [Xanthomonas hortorum pv. vitians]